MVKGHKYSKVIGTRAEVWHGTAHKTAGGLTKSHLMKNKAGRIVSKAKHMTAKKEKRLLNAGYGTQKGKFGAVKLNAKSRKSRKGSKKMRGGNQLYALSPSTISGIKGTSGVNLQFVAGQGN